MAEEQSSVALKESAARLIRRHGDMCSSVLSFRPTGTNGSAEVVGAMRAAVVAANATADAEVMTGGAVAAGTKGPLVVVSWDGTATAAVQPWLDGLAVALSRAGYAGIIQPAPTRQINLEKALDAPYRIVPTMLAGYRLTRQPQRGETMFKRFGTTPGDAFRRSAAHLAAWGAELTDAPRNVLVDLYAGANDITETDLTDWLASTATLANSLFQLRYYQRRRRTLRQLNLAYQGQLSVQECDDSRPWQELVDQARTLLLIDPAALDVGQVRNAMTDSVHNWDSLQYPYVSPGHQTPMEIGYSFSRHLWHERVTDAAGIQLLTGAHLAHAATLDRWKVVEVAPDRYLVEAADLDPWFTQDAPDPEVLDQARLDFGDMILADVHNAASPGPSTR